MDDVRSLLEHVAASAEGEALLAAVAFVAAQDVEFPEDALNAALRRALLLLAAGGDPHRALEPGGRAVRALAADLDTPSRRAQLAAALDGLAPSAVGLPGVAAALDTLRADADLAWRSLACALLAGEVAGEGDV